MSQKYTIKVTFRKSGYITLFSQLDMFRFLCRALRRASLPVFYTSGFNPHPRLSMGPALKLGKSGNFWIKFYFEEKIAISRFTRGISPQIPKELIILSVEK